uniref:Laminin subunit alpha 2 n=1 Tax=Tetraodon nigroviridis TaxID=99883 RepID=H3DG70_TETNG
GLFPAVLNLASMAEVSANATCGSLGPEMYCKLVEHVPGQPVRNPQCRICNQRSVKPFEKHPIEYAIDGTNRWWQSPSIKNGMEYHYVTITLDLKQVFQIAYVIVKAANSPRPGNWILERSIDGMTFEPWQYYAITDTECLTRFNITPRTFRGIRHSGAEQNVSKDGKQTKLVHTHPMIHHLLLTNNVVSLKPVSQLIRIVIRLEVPRADNHQQKSGSHRRQQDADIGSLYARSVLSGLVHFVQMCVCVSFLACDRHAKQFQIVFLNEPMGEVWPTLCPTEQTNRNNRLFEGKATEQCGVHVSWLCANAAEIFRHIHTLATSAYPHTTVLGGFFDQIVTEIDRQRGHGRRRSRCQQKAILKTTIISFPHTVNHLLPFSLSFFQPLSHDFLFFIFRCLLTCTLSDPKDDSCVSFTILWELNVQYCLCLFLCGFVGCHSLSFVPGQVKRNEKISELKIELNGKTNCKAVFKSYLLYFMVTKETTFIQNLQLFFLFVTVSILIPISSLSSIRMSAKTAANYLMTPNSLLLFLFNSSSVEYRCFVKGLIESPISTSLIRKITRRDFLTVLANLTGVMVRASYSTEPSAVYRLHSFAMQIANPFAQENHRASAVEICSCPTGYAGTSCEACIAGFRRVNGNLYNGVCPCNCHGHASQCHEVTGHCLAQTGTVTGRHGCTSVCFLAPEKESDMEHNWHKCPSSIQSRNFSPTCHLSEGGELLCDQCWPGYTGPRRERCSNGYYGQPTVPGGSCQPCHCHGNLDLAVPDSCDPVTGQCLRCRQGYSGTDCESCADGYYGDALTAKNCKPCQCHANGSISEVCSKETGQCRCKENVIGRKCDNCMSQTHGLNTRGVCVPCHCNSFGSKSFDCDERGQCRCQPGVTGPKCDRCARGFFNFQEGGCTPCECSHVGNNCDANTGQCICPPNTIGERCDRCAPNHWGHDIINGCKECGCSVVGSMTQQCNINTGCCSCHDTYRGEKCDECQIGFRDFPQCTQCECHFSGSDSQTCDPERKVCACADQTGKCVCKTNVAGHNCDTCKPNTFGLSVKNPFGCSRCYCYGLTQSCSEAQGLIRMWLTLKPDQTVLPLVDRSNTVETRRGVSFQHPEILVHADLVEPALTEPYYWKLPGQFRGSMITAYGGQLKYAVYYEARDETGPSSYEPQLIIKGGPNHNILMTRHVQGLQIGQLTRHEIDMTEHEWKFADGQSMTREDFMDILFYVDYILIRASHGNLMRHSRYTKISLTVAEEGRPSRDSERAHQVEECDCPIGYSGLSCEECAAGFYRLRAGWLASAPPSRLPTAAGMGGCVQCQCSGHSSTCDPETSICQNCQDNTEGDHCERCAPGFYGVVRGFHEDCKPCACPLTNPENNKSFSPTCVEEGLDAYRCLACPEGYEGKHCERCATGYRGNPQTPGGRCEECKCSLWGAWPGPCDPVTGQCRCRVGATGQSCDQCMERHVCGPTGIISCDDECSGLLISDMDRLYRIITDVTLTTPLPPPYKLLYRFENMTEELKRISLRTLVLKIGAKDEIEGVLNQAHITCEQATKVSADGEQVEDDAARIHKRAEELEQFVRDTLLRATDLQLKAAEVNKTLSRNDGSPDKSLKVMKEDIQAMLAEMRKRQLAGQKSIAEFCISLAEELYQKVKRLFGDPHQSTEDLKAEIKEKLADHGGKLQEAQDLLHSARGNIRQAGSLAEQNQANLAALEKKRFAVSKVKEEAKGILEQGEHLLEEANQLSDNINKEVEELEEMEKELGPLGDRLEVKVSHLTDGLGNGRLANHVLEAEDHAKQLNESAAILDRFLVFIRKVGIIHISYAVHVSLLCWTDTAAKLTATKAVAADANTTAIDVLERLGELNLHLHRLQRNYSELEDTVNAANQMIQDPEKNTLKLNNCTCCKLNIEMALSLTQYNTVNIVSAISFYILIVVKEECSLKALLIFATLSSIAVINQFCSLSLLPHSSLHTVHAAGAKVKDLEDETDRLLEKLQPIRKLQDNLRRNISQIKELINQARKQANSIKVSVSSGGDCLRSYRPDIRKGRYNTITLHVKTTTPDNLLFYLGSAKFVDFLALEMRKGKINFLWDVGSGVGRVEYPHHTIHDGNWHRIEASRNGLNGTVSVYPLEGPMAGMMPTPVSANSPSAYTILDVDQKAYLFVGGIFGKVKKADVVRTSTFTGCMGETFMDGKPIGLWNYRERQGDCKGCVISPQRSDGEGTVQLDGEGYATVGRPTSNYFILNNRFDSVNTAVLSELGWKDFMSLELSEGKVRVNFDLGSGVGSATSANRHNDGRWKSLTMSRNKKQATVTLVDIDSGAEEKIMVSSQGSAAGLNLKENQRIYFGGLPSIGNYRPEITLKRYAGCLREIEVSRTPYNLLSSSDYTGVTKGCNVENLYTVSFSKPGYVELRGFLLTVGTEISLSFSTLEDTGTILLAVGGTLPVEQQSERHVPYLSVMLNKGNLEVLMFTGSHSPRRVLRRLDQGVLNDGREHSLRIERLPGRLSFAVQVDEEAKREAALPNDQSVNLHRLFLGGIPAEVEQTSNRVNVPFQGCIWNLMINAVLSDFSQPVSFENAEIGQCPNLAPPPPPPLLPDEEDESRKDKPEVKPLDPSPVSPPDLCASAVAPAVLEDAYQFGLTRNTHMSFAFDDVKVREKLILEFELRAKEESGLLLYMARINHADFVSIQIKDGQACLGYDLGHGNISGCVPYSINDGNWHKIRVSRNKQRAVLLVDGRYSKQMISPNQADLLDVVGMLYIGGLPQNYTTKRIGPILHSINGCIRNLRVMGGPSIPEDFNLNMATPTSRHMVGSCFDATEMGTFFDGTGFLKAVSSYRVGLDVSIAFQFRTSRTNGVIVAISNQARDGLGIEIFNGKLLFHVDNGAGRVTAEHVPSGEGFCDGSWHTVVARKLRHRLELVVDGEQSQAESPNARSNTCDTDDPIYVGGYPAGVHQAALSTSTSFRGCLKNLKITKASKTMDVHFSKALEIRGVQPLSCPAAAA